MASGSKVLIQTGALFANPFQIGDLAVFDDETLWRVCLSERANIPFEILVLSLRNAPDMLRWRVQRRLTRQQRLHMRALQQHPCTDEDIEHAQRVLLDRLFWELTYWKTPELYEELTQGEHLHPSIFPQFAQDIRGKDVLDIGAGSGRATFECLRYGASRVYAVEPSPGLRRILERKLSSMAGAARIVSCSGYFEDLPLEDESVDLALSCSAFTSFPGQGGEAGLAELKRVTRPGGKIILIWPRIEDRAWLEEHKFVYVSLSNQREMYVRFRSYEAALECARRFYARNHEVARYVLTRQSAEVPFSILGMHPPCEYCWLQV
ncbi:class I SAM-dependent methyltransferase [Ktedonospora formicarum]|uniref:Methyltransferase type 11 domain-containing protein n=1 Tax=Ktedonospora formicarum TaxID=2778364 RepID=A0A8J3I2K8_9CHLR|nr:class I SAM-dependent methyltransferase [Ktedonospora formicarum]GHO44883.1 hypothetical protein KSX_30460 [Ktedonospora formicarum]